MALLGSALDGAAIIEQPADSLAGVVRRTWLHGEVIDFETPRGRLIRRGMTES